MKLFSGTANRPLSEEIAHHMGLPLSGIEIVRFENSEVRVQVQEDVKNETCVVLQSISNPTDTHLVEFFFMCDALRREEAKKVIGVVSYFGYARQNIQHREGECVSANVVIRTMEAIGFHKIYTIDMHDEGTGGVFTIPFRNLSAFTNLSNAVKEYLQIAQPTVEEFAIVSPDQGGIERARKFGQAFFGNSDFHLAVTEKKRDQDRIHQSVALDLYGDVSGKTIVLVDDIATSAGTLVHSADLCMKHGAKRIIAAVTHPDFSSKASENIQNSPIEIFFTSNSIAIKEEHRFEKLRVIPIGSLVADELRLITS